MAENTGRIVTGYAKMWPRAVFEMKEKNKHPVEAKARLQSSGLCTVPRRPALLRRQERTPLETNSSARASP